MLVQSQLWFEPQENEMASKDTHVPAQHGGKPGDGPVGKTNSNMKKLGRGLAKVAAQKGRK